METNQNFAGRHEAKTRIPRLDVRKGRLSLYKGANVPPEEYNYAHGQLKGISLRSRETAGGEITFMILHFKYGESSFEVSSIASSSISADLISRLVNMRDKDSEIQIDVWPKDNYTNCAVRENGEKLPFSFLPKSVRKQNGFNVSVDSSERDAAVMKMIEEINQRIGYVPSKY